jgi:hypothetical protein
MDFPYRKPDPDDPVVLPGPSWCGNNLDLWGIGFTATAQQGCYPFPQRNPKERKPKYRGAGYREFGSEAPLWANRMLRGLSETGQQYSYWEGWDELEYDDPARWPGPPEYNQGISLSHNEKTVISISQHQQGTCNPSCYCHQTCYGYGVRFLQSTTAKALIDNRNSFRMLESADDVRIQNIAEAIAVKCRQYGCDYIRWNGVGDLTQGQLRIIVALAEDPTFTVWGFTRRPEMLALLPVQDNIVFWLSIDESMDPDYIPYEDEFEEPPTWCDPNKLQTFRRHHNKRRFKEAALVARTHGTGFAYTSSNGVRYKLQRDPITKLVTDRLRLRSEYQIYQAPDWYLGSLLYGYKQDLRYGAPISVCFGYHGRSVTTRLSVNEDQRPVNGFDECPATDPFGGGHFFGACYQCRWCMQKPAQRRYKTLLEHRLNTTVRRWPDGVHISLHDGREV